MRRNVVSRRFRNRYQGTAQVSSAGDLRRYILDSITGYHTAIRLSGRALGIGKQNFQGFIPVLLHERLETLELESVQPSTIENEELWELFISRLLKHKNVRKLELYGVMPPLKLSTLVDTSRVDLALRTIFLNTLFLPAQQLMRFGKILEINHWLRKLQLEFIESDAIGGLSQLMLSFGKSAVYGLEIGVQQLSAFEIFCLARAIKTRNRIDRQEPRRFKLWINFKLRECSSSDTSALKICLAASAESTRNCESLAFIRCLSKKDKNIVRPYFEHVFQTIGLAARVT